MKVNQCIFFQLAKAAQSGTRFWTKKVTHLGVTGTQAMVLNFLGEKDEVTSRFLGERTQLDSATLTGIIDRLEAMDFVERKKHPEDRRAILVCLTKKGKELATEINHIMKAGNREFLRRLNRDEENILHGLLERVRIE